MTWMVGRAWALASACLLVGCNDRAEGDGSGSGTDTGTETDSATGADSTGEPPFFGVRRNTVVTFVAADGSLSTRSYDPTEYENTWAVEVGAGAMLQSFPGEYDGVGWLEFPDVPEGPYVLHDSGYRPVFMALDVRDIDADGALRAGRNTALMAQTETPQLSLTVSSMTPLGEEDELQLYSRSVDALLWSLSPYGRYSPGATELDDWTFSWDAQNVVGDVPLVEPLAGDDLWLLHSVSEPLIAEPLPDDPWATVRRTRLVDVASLELEQAIDDGTIADASGSFEAVATEPVSLDLRLGQFGEELDANLRAQSGELDHRCWVRVVVAPGEDVPVQGMAPTLAGFSISKQCDVVGCEAGPVASDRVVELEVGNPFDFGTETLEILCRTSTHVSHPETHTGDFVSAMLQYSRPLADAGPIALGLGMPSDIRIDGEPCGVGDVLTGVGTTPTISLSAPGIGVVDAYEITILRLYFAGDGGDPVGSYETAASSFTLPEGLLEPGGYYYLEVAARSGRRLGEARAYSHEQHVAVAVSGVFTP